MKTPSLILQGRTWCILASLIVLPHAGAQPQKPPEPPVVVAEPVPEVKREGRPGLLFGGNRPVPKTEPEIIEIVPEAVARERAKQRSKETEGTVEGTLGPNSTIVIAEPVEGTRVEPRRSSNGAQRTTITGSRTKSNGTKRQERLTGETLVLPSTPAPVISEVPPSPAGIREERSTVTETRETPRAEVSTTAKRTTKSSSREIEQLQKKVKDLEQEVAEARREPEKMIAPTPPTTPASTRPLPIPVTANDVRQPLVVDTPPPSAAVSTKTETVRTGKADTVVTSELPATKMQETKATQETVVNSEPPQPRPPQPKLETKETPTKVDTSEVAETTPRPNTEPTPASSPQVEAKITTTAPGKIDKLPTESDVPVAEKTDKAGYVQSPFPPHKLIDVTGLPKGSLAKDPTTMKVFRVP